MKLLFVIASLAFWGCASDPVRNQPLDGTVDLQGHRGARGLLPENTLPAFKAAYDHDMNTIELDVTLTRDKKLIVHHDVKLNAERCVFADGREVEETPIAELTASQMKELDCGRLEHDRFPKQTAIPNTRPPTLREVLAYVQKLENESSRRQRVWLNIEAKFDVEDGYTKKQVDDTARTMLAAINSSDLKKRIIVQSFVMEFLTAIGDLDGSIKLSALFKPSYWQGFLMYAGMGDNARREVIAETLHRGAEIISPHKIYVTPEFVYQCHKKGLQVVVWTVNKKRKMRELLNMGVDGIISDYPNKLRSVHQKWLARR